jgi:hypothetical protein
MPNSAWTETANPTSLLVVTAPVDGSSVENINYLTNADKITLMAQYAAALATKTQLDTTAAGLGISSSYYDNAVANISSALIAAGAPANWATTWPDGTTSGPWTNIQGNLANLWAQIASQQTAMQTAISAIQATAAQAAAVATAASAATTQISAAVNVLTAAPLVVSSLPTLPNATYPAGRQVLDSANSQIYTNVAGVWTPLAIPAASISGQITATQITPNSITTAQIAAGAITAGSLAANTITAGQIAAGAIGATQIAAGSITAAALTLTAASLIPDPDFASGTAGWAGFVQRQLSSAAAVPSGCPAIYAAQFNGRDNHNLNTIPVNAGETYFVSVQGNRNGGSGGSGVGVVLYAYNSAGVASGASPATSIAAGWNSISAAITIPTGTVAISVGPWVDYSAFVNGSSGAPWFTNMVLRRMTDASLIVDGTITASKISAGAITADMITTGTLNATLVTVTNLNAGNITTGTLSAAKVLFNDGTALTSASRVLTVNVLPSGSLSFSGSATPAAVPGLGWTMIAASGADTFNISAALMFNYSSAAAATIYIVVDGNIASPAAQNKYFLTGGASSAAVVALFASITGLSAGTHTIAFYASGPTGVSLNGTYGATCATCQRIF